MRPEYDEVLFTNAELFIRRLPRHFLNNILPVQMEFCNVGEATGYAERLKGNFSPISVGGVFGKAWEYAWFKITAEIPHEYRDKTIALRLNLSGDCLIFAPDGEPFISLTSKSVFDPVFLKDWFEIPPAWIKDGKLELWVEANAAHYLGMELDREPRSDSPNPRGYHNGTVNTLQLGTVDQAVRELYFDLEILMSLLYALPKSDFRRPRWLRAFNDAIEIYRENPANAETARIPVSKVLGFRASGGTLTATAIGNAHIDLAWLWRTKESIRKSARTFASQLYNMERFPGYVFGASQAVHYQMVKDNYPGLYRRIAGAVAKGRWEILGGVWVEADCNITGGESLIRQFLHGKNFFKKEFGFESSMLWQPDVFGYPATLPQIMTGCGCKYFLTQKISWSRFHRFPFNTFIWRGIDGSEVLSHFPPEDTYNSEMLPASRLCYSQDNFAEKDFIDEYICAFGMGDGGGGPAEQHLQRAIRCQDLDGVPHVRFGRVDEFFNRMEQYRDKLDVWDDELYLELHQGTLTTHADIKKQNRRCEQLLSATEAICTACGVDNYPSAEFDRIWKLLLNNQFHDILPGSSIAEVYEDSAKELADVASSCHALQQQAAAKLFIPDENHLTLVNTLSCEYSGVQELPGSWQSAAVNGRQLLCQKLPDGKVIAQIDIPAWGIVTLEKSSAEAEKSLPLSDRILENNLVRAEFDDAGHLISFCDKTSGKEVLQNGQQGNDIRLYMDYYSTGTAWDIDVAYEANSPERPVPLAPATGFKGPLRSELTTHTGIGNLCGITQHIRLERSSQIDFVTSASWHEDRKILRVYFPVDVVAKDAAYDIQYGYIRRPTHANNGWEWAKFESACHRYMDLSDQQHGVALLNDCKYGGCVRDNTLSLTLLRAPKYPDRTADMADDHQFTYSLFAHAGDLVDSGVMSRSAMLNRRPQVFKGIPRHKEFFPVSIEGENISLEVLKKAENSNSMVIRLVETAGRTSRARLHFDCGIKSVTPCNLIEWEKGMPIPVDISLDIELKPFKIQTYLLDTE